MFKLFIAIPIAVVLLHLANTSAADCPKIKLKRQWGGKPADEIDYQVRPVRYVIIHHTVTEECSTFVKCASILKNIQHFHMDNLKFDDIGYNFMIGNDGVVYEGTGWGVTGAHTYGYNKNGTGIAFIGNFVEKLPSQDALTAAKELLACGIKDGDLSPYYRLLAGSQVINSESPGLMLYNEIQDWDNWVLNP